VGWSTMKVLFSIKMIKEFSVFKLTLFKNMPITWINVDAIIFVNKISKVLFLLRKKEE
jgi:hypothetical protein